MRRVGAESRWAAHSKPEAGCRQSAANRRRHWRAAALLRLAAEAVAPLPAEIRSPGPRQVDQRLGFRTFGRTPTPLELWRRTLDR